MSPDHAGSTQPVAVDIFCGAGGLSYGMKRAGIEIIAGIDIDPISRHPFEANVNAAFHEVDVASLQPAFVDSLFDGRVPKILAGCAPCQPFSSYTNNRHIQQEEWKLLSKFGELLSDFGPEIVTMENVPRLEKHSEFDEFLKALDQAGYEYNYHIVRCAEYGVPQTRRRLVLLASRLGEIDLIPPTHSEEKFETVRDAIGQLDPIEAGVASDSDFLHRSSGLSDRNLDRIKSSRPGGSWLDWDDKNLLADCHTRDSGQTYKSVYGRMQWDRPAPTITTQFHGYGNGRFGHPSQNRAISLREGALLQTFPLDYSFVPENEKVHIAHVARLIGNAVPVRLGEAIGMSIIAHLEKCKDE